MVLTRWRRWFLQQSAQAMDTCRTARVRRRSIRPRFETLEERLSPATHTWTGAASVLWSDARNWVGGSPAGDSNAALVFPVSARTATDNDLDNLTVQSINLVSVDTSYVLIGQPITLTGGIASTAATGGSNTIGLDMTLSSAQTWNASGNLNIAGTVALNAGVTLTVTTADAITFTGALSGPGGLTVAAINTGGVVLAAADTYAGATIVSSGTLHVGATNAVSNASAVTVAGGATLDLGKFSDTIGSLTGAGNVVLAGGVLTSGGDNTSTTFSGIISGSGQLIKAGKGTLTLSGANTYSSTSVVAGTLLANGPQSANSVTVSAGATLGGSGIVGPTTVMGAISPGGAGPAVFRSGDVAFDPGSSFIIKVNGSDPGSGYDQLGATGSVRLAGNPTLVATAGFAAAIGNTFTILTSSGGITGTFNGLPNNAMLNISGQTFQIAYTSNSVVLTRVVSAPTVTLTSSPNASVFGQPVTFTATVAATPPAIGTPTGAVNFMEGTTVLGTATLDASGVATFTTTTPLATGTHVITAVYTGDRNFTLSSSSPLKQTVSLGIPVVMTLNSSANPSTFSQPVTFTATVAAPAAMPTGNITFREGSTILGTATLSSSGLAALTTAALGAGTHLITADYSGDSIFTPSTSAPLTQSVRQAATTAALSTSPDPSMLGQPVTFTATITPFAPAAGTPTGTVTFQDGSTILGSGTLDSSGHATITASNLAVGSHAISVVYSGDVNFMAANSAPSTQTVKPSVIPAATTATVTSSANPSIVGSPITFTAMVRAVSPSETTPTGTITFLDGSTTLGTASLNSSDTASLTITALAVGNHSITASYSGDANFHSVTSPALTQTVLAQTVKTKTPNEAFVTALYRDVLQRVPDASGFNLWVQQLQQGVSRATVAMAFETSVEYRGLEVDQFFQAFLHRPADAAGRAFWVSALVNGRSESDVVAAFVTSPEYTATHGDNASYVNGLYQDVLGHAADPAGAASWQDLLQRRGQNRAQVALDFLRSTEAYLEAVDSYYTNFLGRPADPAGRQANLAALQSGNFAPTAISTVFLASDEFLAHAIALADA
jgi:autotransporter-associated beta strand protein